MIFLRFISEGLAARSYLIGSGREAVVVDPRRDVDEVLEAARARCVKIRYVLETHRHEDFVLGSTAVRAATGAPVCRGESPAVKYADRRLKDSETLRIGGLLIKALETPGHTPDSLSFALYEAGRPDVALMAFSGDALFAGSCGRVDLNGEGRKAESAELLYRSLHEKLLPLGDQAILCPAHGAGSVCGRGISDRDEATIGSERTTNRWLAYDRETFVREKVAESPPFPPYFRLMERLNSDGPPPLPEAPVPAGVGQLGQALREEATCLVDTRMPTAFAGGHVPGSLSIFLDGMAAYPGWLIDPGTV
ncbi:MAG TPA: MBL fold metallo-hydrolase, partial [Methanocella sp.]|nr:MBL fold metallo-hydrolase [Methanocella sp.]